MLHAMARQTQIIILILLSWRLNGQIDSIIKRDNYIILISGYNLDTINRVDNQGKKQGKWIEYIEATFQTHDTSPTGKDGQKRVEYIVNYSGNYLNNKREGLWINFDGRVRQEFFYSADSLQTPIIIFVNGRLNSKITFDYKLKRYREINFDHNFRVINSFTSNSYLMFTDPEAYVKKFGRADLRKE